MKFLVVFTAICFLTFSSYRADAAINITQAPYNAVPGSDSTAAFQAAISAAGGPGGVGAIYVPGAAQCYLLGAINATNLTTPVRIYGDGDSSCLKITGVDLVGNWMDWSGSNMPSLEHLKIVDNGTAVPNVAILWACTGANCSTSGILSGFTFDHVNQSVHTRNAIFYGYGFGCVAGYQCGGGGSLNISNSRWQELQNGGSATDYLTGVCNAPLVLDALNSRNIRSAYVNVTTSTAVAWRTTITNTDFVDFSAGSGKSNNCAAQFTNVNQLTMIGGSFQCVCYADLDLYSNNEGLTFIQTAFEQPDGQGAVTYHWVYASAPAGSINGILTFISPFWSAPVVGFIGLGAPVIGLSVQNTDPGANSVPAPFFNSAATGCPAGISPATTWIGDADVSFLAGANTVISCGSIHNSIFRHVGPVYLPNSAVDKSNHLAAE